MTSMSPSEPGRPFRRCHAQAAQQTPPDPAGGRYPPPRQAPGRDRRHQCCFRSALRVADLDAVVFVVLRSGPAFAAASVVAASEAMRSAVVSAGVQLVEAASWLGDRRPRVPRPSSRGSFRGGGFRRGWAAGWGLPLRRRRVRLGLLRLLILLLESVRRLERPGFCIVQSGTFNIAAQLRRPACLGSPSLSPRAPRS